MKRLTKLFTLLLALCLLLGVVAISAAAVKSEDAIADHISGQYSVEGVANYKKNTDGTLDFSQSSQLGNTNKWCADDVTATIGGDSYRRFYNIGEGTISSDKLTTAGYFSTAIGDGSNSKVMTKNYSLAVNSTIKYQYATVDFDFMSDRYVYHNASANTYKTYTAEELAAAGLTPESDGVDLAMHNGQRFYFVFNYWEAKIDADTETKKTLNPSIYFVKDAEGNWYYANQATYDAATKRVPVSGYAQYDHITVTASLSYNESTGKTTLIASTFVNGQHIESKSVSAEYLSANMQQLRLNIHGTLKRVDSFSYGIDNLTVNYYKGADSGIYTTGDAVYGLDDYFADSNWTKKPLYNCQDTVCTRTYLTRNGYLQVNDGDVKGDFVSIPGVVSEELAKVKNGSEVVTTRDILDLEIPEGVDSFTVKCDNTKVNVTLSESALANYYRAIKSESGYSVMKLSADAAIPLKWYGPDGKLLGETSAFYGETPVAPKDILIYDAYFEAGKVYYKDEVSWSWNLNGEVSALTMENVKPGEAVELRASLPAEYKVLEGATFFMGNIDLKTLKVTPVPASDGTFGYYVNQSGKNMLAECEAMTYGNVCTLLADFNGEGSNPEAIFESYNAKIPAGKTLYFDVNGHKLVKDGLSNDDGVPFFYVQEESVLNAYSTVPGGEIYSGHLRKSSRTNQTMSAGGLVRTVTNTNVATVNIGDLLDEDGDVLLKCGNNFSYSGGTIFVMQGSDAAVSDDKFVNLNINGGFYYYPLRGTYAFITLQSPDLNANIDGITLYGTYSSASLFHEYDGKLTHVNATVTNSNIYSNFILYRTTPKSSYTFENCVLAGKFASNYGAEIIIGKGNVICNAAEADGALLNKTGVKLASGIECVTGATSGSAVYTDTFQHAKLYIKWADSMDLTYPEGAAIEGVVDTDAEAALLTNAKLKAEVWNVKVTTTVSYNITHVTFEEGKEPASVATILWKDFDGNVVATSKALVGSENVTAPVSVNSLEGYSTENYKWYAIDYKWANENGGDTVVSGENVYVPTAYVKADISGKKANMTLADGMTFNLYLPIADENVTDIKVSGANAYGVKNVATLGDVYVISVNYALIAYGNARVTVSYKVDGVALSLEIKLNALVYIKEVARAYECGSEESILAYQILAYKQAVSAYLEAPISDSEKTAIAEIDAIYAAHTDCSCVKALDVNDIPDEEKSVNYDTTLAGKITSINYLLNSNTIGLRIYAAEGIDIYDVYYTALDGSTKSLNAIYQPGGYYTVNGIPAASATAIITICIDSTDGSAEGTYSLGRYIVNNPEVEIAKALYSYAKAAYKYKVD